MSWRYQVVKHRIKLPGIDASSIHAVSYAIHEAYLKPNTVEIRTITVDPIVVRAESVESLRVQLKRMLEDLEEFGVVDYEAVVSA